MSKLETIRSKLDKKLFSLDGLGSTVTIYKLTRTDGDFGGYDNQSYTYDSGTDVIAVPYNAVTDRLTFHSFGEAKEGDIDIVFRYDVSIDVNDKVTMNGINYYVNQVKNIPLNGGTVAIICRLSRMG